MIYPSNIQDILGKANEDKEISKEEAQVVLDYLDNILPVNEWEDLLRQFPPAVLGLFIIVPKSAQSDSIATRMNQYRRKLQVEELK